MGTPDNAQEENKSTDNKTASDTENVKEEEKTATGDVDSTEGDCALDDAEATEKQAEKSPGDAATSGQPSASESDGEMKPPSPSSAPVVAPFTSADTFSMKSLVERKEDDLSLVVNVDDTQIDSDRDMCDDASSKANDSMLLSDSVDMETKDTTDCDEENTENTGTENDAEEKDSDDKDVNTADDSMEDSVKEDAESSEQPTADDSPSATEENKTTDAPKDDTSENKDEVANSGDTPAATPANTDNKNSTSVNSDTAPRFVCPDNAHTQLCTVVTLSDGYLLYP